MFRAVPEAKDAYDAWDMPGDPLPYIVFSCLEESLLTPALKSGDNPDLLKRIFKFLERMALSRSEQVVNLLWVVCSRRGRHRQIRFAMPSITWKGLASQAALRIAGQDLASME